MLMDGKMRIKIVPSIITARFDKLDEELEMINKSGADMLHVDVYPFILGAYLYSELTALNIGLLLLDFVKRRTKIPIDLHLSIDTDLEFVKKCVKLGADRIIIHPEILEEPDAIIDYLVSEGVEVGLGVTVSSDLTHVERRKDRVDEVVLVAVNANFGGRIRFEEAYRRLKKLRKICGGKVDIAIDGGVNTLTISKFIESGANVLVVGKFIFRSSDYRKAVEELRRTAEMALKKK